MRNNSLLLILALPLLLNSACGVLAPAAPQSTSPPALTPKATALSRLPDTWTPVPTNTPLPPTPTRTPTQDPANFRIGLVMAAEPIPYPEAVLDRTGWEVIEGKTASLAVPPGFQVLDFAGVMMEMMSGLMEALAEGFVDLAQGLSEEMGATPQATLEPVDLEELPEVDFILAVEETSQSALILASVERSAATTTEDLLNEALSDSENPVQVSSRQVLLDAPYPMERVFLDVADPDLGPGVQIIYVILGPDRAWNLVFTAPADQVEAYLPLYESVVDSFSPLQ